MNVTRLFRNVFNRNNNSKRRPPNRKGFPKLQVPSIANPFSEVYSYLNDTRSFLVILNWLGYIFLLASVVDYFLILYPPQLTNPRWELQAVTDMVNNAWFLLLSLILIFIPNRTRIRRLELNFLSLLRWIVLFSGVIFILLLPLGIINTQRIHEDTVATVIREETTRRLQLTNVEEAIKTQDIPKAQLERIGDALGLEETPESATVKEALLKKIDEQKAELRERVEATKSNRFRQLMRQSVRTHVGAVLIGVFLIRLWWEARWLQWVRDQSSNS
jgi:hypothetical protein